MEVVSHLDLSSLGRKFRLPLAFDVEMTLRSDASSRILRMDIAIEENVP
jgi:hypothetical protein